MSALTTCRRLAYLCLQATREGQASFTHVHEVIKGLRKRGWQVDLYEPPYARAPHEPPLAKKLLHFVGAQIQLLRALRTKRYDAVYIRHHPFDPITVAALRLLKMPIILEVNGPYEDLYLAFPWTRPFRWVWTALMRYGMRQADAVITVTEPLVRWAQQEAGHPRVYLISNGVDIDLFRPDTDLPPPAGVRLPYALFFGVLAAWQGIETLLEAVQRPEWPEPLHLVIAGDGILRNKVEQAAQKCSRIVYLGKLPYRQIPPLIRHSICGVAPMSAIKRNCTGVMPLKVFETLACGIPVVVSDLPGMACLVRQGECGLVTPPEDAVELALAIRQLYEDDTLRVAMGRRGRALIEAAHSWDARAEDTHRLLLQVLER
jgi:glycosyltransferase involved in cell wall biosynthesis